MQDSPLMLFKSEQQPADHLPQSDVGKGPHDSEHTNTDQGQATGDYGSSAYHWSPAGTV